jgi:hypothetical protein
MKNPFGSVKAPKPGPTNRPLMQGHLDMTLPFIVATDAAIWGTFPEFHLATSLADRIAEVEPYGSRILVMLHGKQVYAVPGQASISRLAATRAASPLKPF